MHLLNLIILLNVTAGQIYNISFIKFANALMPTLSICNIQSLYFESNKVMKYSLLFKN
jgi:hypothetical protein